MCGSKVFEVVLEVSFCVFEGVVMQEMQFASFASSERKV